MRQASDEELAAGKDARELILGLFLLLNEHGLMKVTRQLFPDEPPFVDAFEHWMQRLRHDTLGQICRLDPDRMAHLVVMARRAARSEQIE